MIRRILARFRNPEPEPVDDFIDTAMRCAKAKHVLRNGIPEDELADAYNLSGPIANARDQWIADNLPKDESK